MERTIISHDIENAIARIRFEHNDVTLEQKYSLWDAIPSTRYIFDAMGITELTEEMQSNVIDRIEAVVLNGIETGVIQNPPEATVPEYQAPPVPEEGGE